ncbi:uncharacterized protein LOC120721706 [Simochromis diagramma]|uniref:uncharacterized protein LOC120721706 n=1 Tax=Simochromis diagramma TaxID=43689 RepID=UPI001A7EF845|nr:uncharacterized protein LOC120721706 [Simochromis diagramma]
MFSFFTRTVQQLFFTQQLVPLLRAMAAAVFSRIRGPTIATKGLFLIFSLLCLASVASSQASEEQRILEAIKQGIKDTNRWKAEDKYRKETITILLDLSSSLTHKGQLELFQETLQRAVNFEERLKARNTKIFQMVTREIDELLENYTRQVKLEMLLEESPPIQEMNEINLRLVKNGKICMDKKKTLLDESRTVKILGGVITIFHLIWQNVVVNTEFLWFYDNDSLI